jgi:hypothetical protein
MEGHSLVSNKQRSINGLSPHCCEVVRFDLVVSRTGLLNNEHLLSSCECSEQVNTEITVMGNKRENKHTKPANSTLRVFAKPANIVGLRAGW